MQTQPLVKFKASFDTSITPFCCGVYEVGGLSLSPIKPSIYDSWKHKEVPNPYYKTAPETPEGVWIVALKSIRGTFPGYPLMFNLIVGDDGTEFLRKLLKKQEDVTHVHSWRNPNSGNQLEMYVLTNGSSPDTEYSDDDYDY